MRLGFIGAGNMARSLAVGLDQPALFADGGSGRAAELAEAVGGRAASLAEVAEGSDVLILAHKPKQLAEVAAQLSGFSGAIFSVLAGVALETLRRSFPDAKTVRAMPNIPVERGAGVLAIAEGSDRVAELESLLSRLGIVVRCPEDQFDLFTAIGGCAPAFFAKFAGALIAAATVRGMDAELAATAVNETMAGTAATLRATGVDTDTLMQRVASPGGLTERALASFDSTELDAAVDAAVATVLGQ